MAKKKKKSQKKVPYKRYLLLGLGGMAALLGVYCFYFSKPSKPVIIPGREHPIKTPGPAAKKEEYEVYQKIVRSNTQQSEEQLLPAQEAPDIQRDAPQTPPAPEAPSSEAASPSSPSPLAPPSGSLDKSISLHVGLIYLSLSQAERGLSTLKKIAPWPSPLKAVVQKALYKNQTLYRLVLSGNCSAESLASYQEVLKKKKIPYARLSPK